MPQFGSNLRIAVISDIHANALALRAALQAVRRVGFDRLVILGDLLSYGCHVGQVTEMVDEAMRRDGAVLIWGNHDQLYAQLQHGATAQYDRLPAWLRESVDWTLNRLRDCQLDRAFAWQNDFTIGRLLLAHANPFPPGDWTYLNEPSDLARAGHSLALKDLLVGVFGHTHRRRMVAIGNDGAVHGLSTHGGNAHLAATGNRRLIVNSGSVGQPRGGQVAACWLMITVAEDRLHFQFHDVVYDVHAHTEAIRQSSLTEPTRQKLLSYFSTTRQHHRHGRATENAVKQVAAPERNA